MKEIKAKENIYLENFDVHVNQYLTYDQIQQIVNAVIKFDSWAERQQNIELLVLYHATNIKQNEIEEIGHDMLLQSGLIDDVCKQIINFDKIYEAIEYTESISKALTQIAKMLPTKMKELEKVINYGSKSSKER